ncbi:hypothetical protein FisN_18Lu302 [Fistulifera solaris]|uniref:Uncharacterized protein n=1 Tax=Fistulifera solaris TaxID=1519565 RepID=A0A1Z5JUU7_FISSO|nr:hypothetical protein FisN_18Lu302 [Fistulifera solaris]|eukprot:GAX17636.1 hypothetical protein FisN_18Lu302 [Fistulifera solaris]
MHLAASIESDSLYCCLNEDRIGHVVLSSPRQTHYSPPAKNMPVVIDPDLSFVRNEKQPSPSSERDLRAPRAVSLHVVAVATKTSPPLCHKPLAAPPRLVNSKAVALRVPIRPPQTSMSKYRGLVALRKAAQRIEEELP